MFLRLSEGLNFTQFRHKASKQTGWRVKQIHALSSARLLSMPAPGNRRRLNNNNSRVGVDFACENNFLMQTSLQQHHEGGGGVLKGF